MGIFLTVYVLVALITYSPTQSLLGACVGNYFSKEWHATVRIGALHVDPFNRVILHDLLLVDPAGDTVADMDLVLCKFHRFPYRDGILEVDQVRLRNAYYYMRSDDEGFNLDFIIDYFASTDTTPDTTPSQPFLLKVHQLDMQNVHYQMKLSQSESYADLGHGVNISQMDYLDVDGRLKNIQVGINGDHIDILCRFVRFSAVEQSGFRLRDLSGDAHVSDRNISFQNMELTTPYTHMLSDLNLDFNGWDAMSEFCDSVVMTAIFQPGTVMSLQDAAYWAPMALWGMDEPIALDGIFYGPVAAMHAEDVHISFGASSHLNLDAFVEGLPYIERTSFQARVGDLHTTYTDLAAIHHPAGVTMQVPGLMRMMGIIDLDAQFDGDQRRCLAQVDLTSMLGDLSANMEVSMDSASHNYQLQARLGSHGLQLSPIWKNEWVTRSAFQLSASMKGSDIEHLYGDIEGRLSDTYIKGNSIADAQLAAHWADNQLVADLEVEDSLLRVKGNLGLNFADDSLLRCNVDMQVDEVNLARLRLIQSDLPTSARMHLRGQAQWSDIESLNGSVAVSGLRYCHGEDTSSLTNLNVNVNSVANYKNISLSSDLANLNVKGYFAYDELPLFVRYMDLHYLPKSLTQHYAGNLESDFSPLADNSIDIDLQWIDRRHLLHNFLPSLQIPSGTHCNATYNFSQGFKLVLTADSLAYGPIVLHDVGLDGHPTDTGYLMQLEATSLKGSDALELDRFRLDVLTNTQHLLCGLHWNNAPATVETQGDLQWTLTGNDSVSFIQLRHSHVVLMGRVWQLLCPKPIEWGLGYLHMDRFSASCEDQRLEASVNDNHVALRMEDFQVGPLAQLLLGSKLDLEALANGEVNTFLMDGKQGLSANVELSDCSLSDCFLDRVTLHTTLDNEQQRLNVEAANHLASEAAPRMPFSMQGYIDFAHAQPQLHAGVRLDSLSISLVAPFLSSFADKVEGSLSGQFSVSGPFDALSIAGQGNLRQVQLHVQPTGVTYYISDTFQIDNNQLWLRDFKIRDDFSNVALVSGSLNLQHLSNPSLSLHLQSDNLALLNRTPVGNQFYGRLFAAVEGSLQGPSDRLNMQVSVRTRPGSTLTVPVDNRKEMSELGYITFQQPRNELIQSAGSSDSYADYVRKEGLSITADVNITPDLQLFLPMQFSQMDVNISAKGSGDLLLNISDASQPQLVGSYVIDNGALRLNLLGFFEKSFAIDRGSTLLFPGDVGRTHFDISAVYSQRVSLSTLSSTLAEKAQQRIQVDDIIAVAGTIDNPEVRFDIRLPNVDQGISDEVFSLIDRTDERDMLNQTVSLLLSGSFYNSDDNNTLNTAAASGYNLVANSMGTMVSNMIKVVDVNFDYKAATSTMSEQFDVDISKEWDKFYFETTIGYGGETRTTASSADVTNLVGDVTLGYRFNPHFQAFVFNRSNTNDFTRTEIPYKQGAGLKWSRDFDSWKELFRRRNKRKNP